MTTTNNNEHIALYIIGGIIVFGVSLYLIRKHRSTKKSSSATQPDTYVRTLDDVNKGGTGSLKSSDKSDIITSIYPVMEYFSGTINPLGKIATGVNTTDPSRTFTSIFKLVNNLGNDILKSWFDEFKKGSAEWTKSDYSEKATELLELLESCGLKTVVEKEFIWSADKEPYYNSLTELKDGDRCVVKQPYWLWQGKIFEKGFVITT